MPAAPKNRRPHRDLDAGRDAEPVVGRRAGPRPAGNDDGTPLAQVRRLRQALDQAAAALAAADLDGLLRSEAALDLAQHANDGQVIADPHATPALREEIAAARRALARCRRLGGVLLDVVRVTHEARQGTADYGPGAHVTSTAHTPTAHHVDARA